ncbi:hypothetical protein EX30DRAFT_47436 [Ascodesmis nigricans]|uniref:Uncharacterized protein n=1 Tax=Ascodesmis nigricans TaxID=341454 RepID=A0A4S2MVL6_9PEZI|nr:hypothetical protein EX30DRAFT_47436 [Ascodesmis nigricans]
MRHTRFVVVWLRPMSCSIIIHPSTPTSIPTHPPLPEPTPPPSPPPPPVTAATVVQEQGQEQEQPQHHSTATATSRLPPSSSPPSSSPPSSSPPSFSPPPSPSPLPLRTTPPEFRFCIKHTRTCKEQKSFVLPSVCTLLPASAFCSYHITSHHKTRYCSFPNILLFCSDLLFFVPILGNCNVLTQKQ